jgi:hypothetical protein
MSLPATFRGLEHTIPRAEFAPFRITAAADVNANGYAVTFGTQWYSGAAKSAEGIMALTPRFAFNQVVAYGMSLSTHLVHWRKSAESGTTPSVSFTFEAFADGTTDTDPDNLVIDGWIVFNVSGKVYI